MASEPPGLEFTDLEFDDEVAQLLDVEEQQVKVEVVASDLEMHLSSDEGELRPELTQGVDNPIHQCLPEIALGYLAGQAKKLEGVRAFGCLLGQL